FFFFQAEDGIRDFHVTGVQTCALRSFGYLFYMTSCLRQTGEPMDGKDAASPTSTDDVWVSSSTSIPTTIAESPQATEQFTQLARSEERRVGKESSSKASQTESDMKS